MHRFLSVLVTMLLISCGGGEDAPEETDPGLAEGCAHVVDGEIERENGTFTVSAAVSSADTGWDKYADAWEVRGEDGSVLGMRELLHPHVDEQPFTRELGEVEIPESVEVVTLAARDSVEGFCGETLEVDVPR